MKVIIHIGTEKTGTTSLQNFMYDNRNTFSEHGYHICTVGGLGNNRGLAGYSVSSCHLDEYHSHIGVLSTEDKVQHDKKIETDFYNEVTNLSSNIHTVILSSEHFHSRCVDVSEVNKLKLLLNKYFDDFEVVVYLRPQVEVMISLYTTILRSGGCVTFKDFFDNTSNAPGDYYNYASLLDRWAKVFGKESVIAKVFSRGELINGDLVSDFIHGIGIGEVEFIKNVENKNESLTPFGQEFLRLMNLNYTKKENDYHYTVELIDSAFVGKGQHPNKEQCANFQSLFNSVNDEVARNWFGRTSLFSVDFDKYGDGEMLSSSLMSFIDFLFKKFDKIEDSEVELIRDAAILVEPHNILHAKGLMEIAKKYRPNGEYINAKLNNYNRILGRGEM